MRIKEYNNASKDGNVIVTVAIGEKYMERWESISLPFWKEYCIRNNLGLYAITAALAIEKDLRADWQKLLVGKILVKHGVEAKNICFVDYDIIPNVFAENIFNYHIINKIGFVSERMRLPYGKIKNVKKKLAFERNNATNGEYPVDSYLHREVNDVFRDHDIKFKSKEYGCGGLFMFNNKEYGEYLSSGVDIVNTSKLYANEGEEVYLNYLIQNTKSVNWLQYKWHTLWCYEVSEKYPILYKYKEPELVLACIINTLKKSNFLHFVGSWEKWAWKIVEGKSEYIKKELYQYDKISQIDLKSESKGQIFPNNCDYISKPRKKI